MVKLISFAFKAKVFFVFILWLIVHFLFVQSLAISQTSPKFPAISIKEALQLTERYIVDNKLIITGQYINSIQLEYDNGYKQYPDGKKRIGQYWYIHWRWSKPRLGGEHSMRIFMDGEIIWETHGP